MEIVMLGITVQEETLQINQQLNVLQVNIVQQDLQWQLSDLLVPTLDLL